MEDKAEGKEGVISNDSKAGDGDDLRNPAVSLSPTDMCVKIRHWIWTAREPFARFIRTFYIQREPFAHKPRQDADPDKVLLPSPSPVTPEDACLKPGGLKLSSSLGRVNLMLLFYFAASSYLALGEPKKGFKGL